MPTYTFAFSTFASSGGGGGSPWNNPGNAGAQDGSFTFTNGLLSGSSTTQYLKCAGPVGLTIPANEYVTAIGFTVWRKADLASFGTSWATDAHIYPIKGGTVQTGATDLADTSTLWPTTNTAKSYGGTTTLGLTWTNADFGSGFGVAIDATQNDPAMNDTVVYIDYISCTLTTAVSTLPPPIILPIHKSLHPQLARIPDHLVREL